MENPGLLLYRFNSRIKLYCMQKAVILSNRIRRIFLCGIAVFLIVSCGIENVIYLEPPKRTYENSDLDDLSKRYCRFTTADATNAALASDYFQGTEIYYRIYERESDCTADKSQIVQYNESSPSNAARYLQDTKKYLRLGMIDLNAGKRPLIGKSASNSEIRFRLQDYGLDDSATLTVNGAKLGIPCRDTRVLSTKNRFEGENIDAADDDVQKASSSSSLTNFWYVNFYAVSYGYDKSFKTLFSELAPLGSIKVEKKS